MNKKKLTLGEDKLLCGVCSGLADYLDIDLVLIRLFWLSLIACNGIGIIPYILFWIVMPSKY